jgi:flagellar biosynthesis protein FlhA
VISFEPQLEQRMLEAMRPGEQGAMIAIDPITGQQMLTQLAQMSTDAENQNIRPVLVCAPQLRCAVRRMVRPAMAGLAVVSYQELTGANQVRSVGVVTGERATVTA